MKNQIATFFAVGWAFWGGFREVVGTGRVPPPEIELKPELSASFLRRKVLRTHIDDDRSKIFAEKCCNRISATTRKTICYVGC
jgi:hypothetical protein